MRHRLAVAADRHRLVRCKGTLGSRPEWMGVDQYDPCRCRLNEGHDGPHWCEHLGSPDPRPAVPEEPQ